MGTTSGGNPTFSPLWKLVNISKASTREAKATSAILHSKTKRYMKYSGGKDGSGGRCNGGSASAGYISIVRSVSHFDFQNLQIHFPPARHGRSCWKTIPFVHASHMPRQAGIRTRAFP